MERIEFTWRKRMLLLLVTLLFVVPLRAQTPQAFQYQAVARDGLGQFIAGTQVSVRITLLQGTTDGPTVYSETFAPVTNAFGLFTLEIGNGTVVSGTFSAIDWHNGPYFMKVELDASGGNNYAVMGTTQLLSVPYALHAGTAESVTETDPLYTSSQASNITAGDIVNLGNLSGMNTGDQDLSPYVTMDILVDTAMAVRSGFPDVSGFITDETDPVFGAWDRTTGISITENQINDLKNYLTTETDPVFTAWDKSTGITITESQISDLKNYLTTESDPAVALHFDFAGETSGDLIRFNGTKWVPFTPGYLTSFTETDPVFSAWDKDYFDMINRPDIADSITDKAVLLTGNQTIAGNKTFTGTIDAGNNTLTNLADPVNNQDAVTKAYVDQLMSLVSDLQEQVSDLEMLTGVDQVTDFDGNSYHMVKVGDQVWMKENLKSTHYADGSVIPSASAYDDDDANAEVHGRFYQWGDMMNGSPSSSLNPSHVQGVCPDGWHVPSDAEWQELEQYLGMSGTDANSTGWRGTNEGGALKEEGLIHWNTPNTGATNATGMKILPTGYAINPGSYSNNQTDAAYFWTATEWDASNSWSRILDYLHGGVARMNYTVAYGFPVRCVKDPDHALILWNKLGSDAEIQQSETGENGDIVGSDYAYEPGMFGNGYVRKATGSNYVHFPASVLQNLKYEGTVELWINPKVTNPVPYSYGVFALIGNVFGTNSHVYVGWGDGVTSNGIYGGVNFDGTAHYTPAESSQFTATPGTPFHIAIVWNVDGIDGTSNTVRIYRDGVLVNAIDDTWDAFDTTTNYDGFYLGMGPDGGGYDKFIVDNIKVWNYAKTDFPDRFEE